MDPVYGGFTNYIGCVFEPENVQKFVFDRTPLGKLTLTVLYGHCRLIKWTYFDEKGKAKGNNSKRMGEWG